MTKKIPLAPPARAPEVDNERTRELPGIIKQAYLDAFEKLGGVNGMVRWARRSPGAFYKQFAALAPQLERHAKNTGVTVNVAAFGGADGKKSLVDLKAIDGTPPETLAGSEPSE